MILLVWLKFCPTPVLSQSALKLNVGSIYSYNSRNLFLGEDEISSSGWGVITGVDLITYPLNKKFEVGAGAGFKHVSVGGTVGEYRFRSESSKLLLQLYGHYQVLEKWKAGVIGIVENNKDFADFAEKGSDHFRYNAGLDVGYTVNAEFAVHLRYIWSLFPNANIYLIQNPSDQLMFILSYKFLQL